MFGFFRRAGKAIDAISSVYSLIGMGLVAFMGFAIVAEVIVRQFGLAPVWIHWATGVVMGTLAWWTAAYAMRHMSHIRVTVFENMMPKRTRLYSQLFGWFALLVFIVILGIQVLEHTVYLVHRGEKFITINIPQWPIYLIVFLGIVLLVLQIIVQMARIATQISPEKDSGKRFWGKPYFILPLYAVVAAGCIYAFFISPLAGAFAILLGFLFIGVPIGASLGSIAFVGMFVWGGFGAISTYGPLAFSMLNEYTWLAVPLFVLGGVMMQRGVASGLFSMITKWVGWLPGGTVLAMIWTGVVLGAMVGSELSSLVLLFMLAMPQLDKEGYKREFTLPLIIVTAMLGPLIPPSVTLVIYGSLAQQSIGALFMAGMGPGLLLAAFLSIYAFVYCLRTGMGKGVSATWGDRFRSIPANLPALGIPILVIGGIVIGWLTPTEAAAAALVYVIIINIVSVPRKLFLKGVKEDIDTGGNLMGFLCLMFIGALFTKYVFVQLQVADTLLKLVTSLGAGPGIIMVMMSVLLFMMGCIGEVFPIVLVLIPTVFPILYGLGLHPWFLCVYLIFMGAIGTLTPPVGALLFVTAGMAKVDPYFIFRRIIPFVIVLLLCVMVLYFVPEIATWVPSHLGFSQPPGF
jgi:C4-dicarboxylate transporter DctM subunit